jgi:hypothetical protein
MESPMPTAEYEIEIACDFWRLSNNTFSADHREIAAQSLLSAEMLYISRQINLQIISIEINFLKTNTNH